VVIHSVVAAILLAGGTGGAPAPVAQAPLPVTPGRELPLPIAVKTPQDLAFKTEVERQYLILNLMAGGRQAYEAGDFARAAHDWELLLKVPSLPPEVARVVSPLLAEAQRQRGGPPAAPVTPVAPGAAAVLEAPPVAAAPAPEAQRPTTVSGTVNGGGAIGPGAAVLWLTRLDGPTPPPHHSRRPRVLNQSNKTFVPHVLAIAVGETVAFRNDDPYFHNVFSLSPGQGFDTGLYSTGGAYERKFTRPGPVELLCNIHASMVGYIYVVNSAYYTQPRSNGAFVIRNVPPGRYELHAWHESAAAVVKQPLTVAPGGTSGVVVRIAGDRPPMVIVPDKYGKPRQSQLGY
jgi:plastocyanin